MPRRQRPKKPTRNDVKPAAPSRVSISFRRCNPGGKWCLSHCASDGVRSVIDTFRMVTELDWPSMYAMRGLKTEEIKDTALKVERPTWLDPGVAICALRVSRRFRLLWYREGDVLHVLWFDPLHEVYDG